MVDPSAQFHCGQGRGCTYSPGTLPGWHRTALTKTIIIALAGHRYNASRFKA